MRFATRLTHFIIKYGSLFHLFLGLLLFWFYSEIRKNINVIVKQVGLRHFLFCFVHWLSCLSSKYIILGAKHRETVNIRHTKRTVKLSVCRAEMFRRLTTLGFSNPRSLSPFSPCRTWQKCLSMEFCTSTAHTGLYQLPSLPTLFLLKKSYLGCCVEQTANR